MSAARRHLWPVSYLAPLAFLLLVHVVNRTIPPERLLCPAVAMTALFAVIALMFTGYAAAALTDDITIPRWAVRVILACFAEYVLIGCIETGIGGSTADGFHVWFSAAVFVLNLTALAIIQAWLTGDVKIGLAVGACMATLALWLGGVSGFGPLQAIAVAALAAPPLYLIARRFGRCTARAAS